MSGHGLNLIFFNKKIKIGHPEHLLTPNPLRPITSHFCLPPHTHTTLQLDVICVSPLRSCVHWHNTVKKCVKYIQQKWFHNLLIRVVTNRLVLRHVQKLVETKGKDFYIIFKESLAVNPLSTNPTEWSNTFKQFIGNCRPIIWVCLTVL